MMLTQLVIVEYSIMPSYHWAPAACAAGTAGGLPNRAIAPRAASTERSKADGRRELAELARNLAKTDTGDFTDPLLSRLDGPLVALSNRMRVAPREPTGSGNPTQAACCSPEELSLIHISEPTRLGMISY